MLVQPRHYLFDNLSEIRSTAWKVLTSSPAKNLAIIAASVTLIIGGIITLNMFTPNLMPSLMQNYWSTQGAWFIQLGSQAALIKIATLVAAASAAIGIGIYGLANQGKKLLHAVRSELENKGYEGSVQNAGVKRRFLSFMQNSILKFEYLENTNRGKMVKVGLILSALVIGVVLLGVTAHYLNTMDLNSIFPSPGIETLAFRVWPIPVKLAIAGLTIGGATTGFGLIGSAKLAAGLLKKSHPSM